MFTYIELDLYFTSIWSSAKFEWKQCSPLKAIEQKWTTKTKSKKGHNQDKIWQMITIYWTWPVIYSDIKFCKVWMKSMQCFKSYWAEIKSVTTIPPPPSPPPLLPTSTMRTDNMIPMCLPYYGRWHKKCGGKKYWQNGKQCRPWSNCS